MNENTKQTNSNKIKRNWLFIAFYFVVGVALVVSAFCKFLNTGTNQIGLADILTFSGALRTSAILSIVLFSAMALTAVVCIVEKFLFLAKEKQSKIATVLIFANVVLLVVCLPGLISAEIHLLRYYQKAAITFAFVSNVVLPVVFCALLIADKKQFIKDELFVGGKQKFGPTTFAYPFLALASLVVLCLPVYSYQMVDKSAGMYTEMLSLFGATVHTSLLNFRSTLFLIVSALVALAMCVAGLGATSAKNKQDVKKEGIYKTCRIAFAVVMLVVAVYCLPAAINFMTESSQYIQGLPGEVYTNEKLGIAYYTLIAIPVLITICCAVDGVNEYLNKSVAKTRVVESGNWQIIRTVFKACYVAVLLVVLLSVSLPFAKYGLYEIENLDFFSFITLYSGVERGYVNGMPATNTMFVYALITAVLAGASLVASFVGQKAPGKRKTVVAVVIKTVCMVGFIAAFAWLNNTISFYHDKFAEIAQITGSYVAIGIAGKLLSVSTIGYLVAVCLDFVVYGTKFLQSRQEKLK
ncbi:MAG: hypothetical protein IKA42_02125 [Clostridia bacterium]|nr:hypothetical protein [Clostridia bacterium]